MLQFNKDYIENEQYINQIITAAEGVLQHREELYKRLTKKKGTPIERYITTTGTSYFAGKEPQIRVSKTTDQEKINIIRKLFDKVIGKDKIDTEYQILLDYINDYNDMGAFFYEAAKDYFGLGGCYWLSYETTDNEIVYAQTSALQSVALYDYSTPVQLIAGLRIFKEKDASGNDVDVAILTLANERRYYKNNNKQKKEYKEDTTMREKIQWELPPFYAVENPDNLALYEPVLDLIDSLEQILTNERNTFQYNDEAKLKVVGYSPEQPILNPDGSENPLRKQEDEAVLKAKVFYAQEGGDIDWIIKNINDTAVQNYTKEIVDFIFMLAMVPNMNDISFTNSDSGKAIQFKFHGLEMLLIEAEKLFQKEMLRMYENITQRVNIEKNTKFDFRDIDITFERNLPAAREDATDAWLKLRGLVSDKTIIEHLPYDIDVENEINEIEEQKEENMENAIIKAKALGKKSQEKDNEEEQEK